MVWAFRIFIYLHRAVTNHRYMASILWSHVRRSKPKAPRRARADGLVQTLCGWSVRNAPTRLFATSLYSQRELALTVKDTQPGSRHWVDRKAKRTTEFSHPRWGKLRVRTAEKWREATARKPLFSTWRHTLSAEQRAATSHPLSAVTDTVRTRKRIITRVDYDFQSRDD